MLPTREEALKLIRDGLLFNPGPWGKHCLTAAHCAEKMNREERLRRQKDFLTGFAFWVVWLVILWVVLKAAGSVLFPFLAAFAVAALLAGAVKFITERTHIKRGIVAVTTVLFFYILLAAVLYFAGSYLVRLIYDLTRELSVFFSDTVVPVMQRFYQWVERLSVVFYPVGQTGKTQGLQDVGAESAQTIKNAGKLMSGISDGVIDGVSGMAAGIPGFFMKLLITVIATVFMELEFPQIRAFLKRQIPAEYQRAFRDGKNYVTGTMGKCIISYCLIFGITFAELVTGLFLLGIKNAFAIAFIIAVLDILPVLGTGTVLIPWAVLAFASGRISTGVGVFGLYFVITVVRNLIEPKLVGKQMGLSPVIMLPCMLIGLKFFGIIGLFVVPLLVSFLKQLNDRGIIKIFR